MMGKPVCTDPKTPPPPPSHRRVGLLPATVSVSSSVYNSIMSPNKSLIIRLKEQSLEERVRVVAVAKSNGSWRICKWPQDDLGH